MLHIKLIAFDFDDTLVQTKVIRYEALKFTGKSFYNIQITNQDIDKYWGLPFSEMMNGVFNRIEDSSEIIKKYKSILHKFPNKSFPDTKKVLQLLKKDYQLALISSSVRDLILSGLKDVNLSESIFDFIQTSDQIEYHKPDPRVFDPLIKYIGRRFERSEVLYIGDTIDDYKSSKSAGFQFIGIANRTTPKRLMDENNITSVFTLSEMMKEMQNTYSKSLHNTQ